MSITKIGRHPAGPELATGVSRLAVAGSAPQRPMCAAIPAAAARWGRAEQGCASRSLETVTFAGEEHPVCGMHLVMWHDAPDWKRTLLAGRWGWLA